jgi:FKBP-type peptidyl-prolyl cis-trans isomerase SlpA
MPETDAIRPGSKVQMHLSLALADGTVAVSTFDEDPMEFSVGDGTLPQTLEENLIGMAPLAEQQFVLAPEYAFGERDPDLVHTMPLSDFGEPPESGQVLSFAMPNGEEMLGQIVTVDGDDVRVDFNPPLAGHNVLFRVQVLVVDNGQQVSP